MAYTNKDKLKDVERYRHYMERVAKAKSYSTGQKGAAKEVIRQMEQDKALLKRMGA